MIEKMCERWGEKTDKIGSNEKTNESSTCKGGKLDSKSGKKE